MNLFKKALQARQADEKGFTLIELIIVIAIIGILVAIAIPVFGGQKDNARLASSKTDARNIGMGIDTTSAESGSFPSTLADSTAKVGEMSLSKDNVFTDYEVAPDGKSFSFFVTNDEHEKSTYATYDSAHGGLCSYGFGTPEPCGDGGTTPGDEVPDAAPLVAPDVTCKRTGNMLTGYTVNLSWPEVTTPYAVIYSARIVYNDADLPVVGTTTKSVVVKKQLLSSGFPATVVVEVKAEFEGESAVAKHDVSTGLMASSLNCSGGAY